MSERMQQGLTVVAGTWIVVTMLFYSVRFTATLYRTHQAEFDAVFTRLGALLGTVSGTN